MVLLPSEFSVPLARHLAQLRVPTLRRHVFSNVYQSGSLTSNTAAVSVRHEAAFDIVDHQERCHSVEAIIVGVDAAHALKPFLVAGPASVVLKIGDTKLTLLLIQLCGCGATPGRELVRSFSGLSSQAAVDPAVKETFSRASEDFSSTLFAEVFVPLPTEPFAALQALRTRMKGLRSSDRRRNRLIDDVCMRIDAIEDTLSMLCHLGLLRRESSPEHGSEEESAKWNGNLPQPYPGVTVTLDLGLCDRHGVHTSGLAFSVSLLCSEERGRKTAEATSIKVAEGGQYDEVLDVFRSPPLRPTDPSVGFGVRIPVERLARSITSEPPATARPVESQVAVRVQVVSASPEGYEEHAGERERLYVAALLWAGGVAADYMPVNSELGGSTDPGACREQGVAFIVVVKPHLLHRDGTVRLLHSAHGSHAGVWRAVHVNDLASRITSMQTLEPPSSGPGEAVTGSEGKGPTKVQTSSTSSSPNVVFVGKCADSAATTRRVVNLLATRQGGLHADDASVVLVVGVPFVHLRRLSTMHMAGEPAHAADFPSKYQSLLLELRDRLADMSEEVEEERRPKKNAGMAGSASAAVPSTALVFSSVDAKFDLVYLSPVTDAPVSKSASNKGKAKRRGSASSSSTGARR